MSPPLSGPRSAISTVWPITPLHTAAPLYMRCLSASCLDGGPSSILFLWLTPVNECAEPGRGDDIHGAVFIQIDGKQI